MTLYGFDLEMNLKGEWKLFEINGITSGMPGFKAIYGDERIRSQVYEMLRSKYGKIAVNDGEFLKWEREEHPFLCLWEAASRFFQHGQRTKKESCLSSPKAHIEWLEEWQHKGPPRFFPNEFPRYRGQECTVFNSVNEVLPHPLVNPYVAQEATRNKLLQYILLRDSEIDSLLIPSAVAGLGTTRKAELEQILEEGKDRFIIKPLKGYQSIGVKVISRKEVESFFSEEGPMYELSLAEEYRLAGKKPLYVEELIAQNNFAFEWGVSLVQPFMDTQKQVSGEAYFTAVRAIVCNGQFVGAYRKYSPNAQVHISHSKRVELAQEEELPSLCEKIVRAYEQECLALTPENYQRVLYEKWINERGPTQRRMIPTRDLVKSMLKIIKRI